MVERVQAGSRVWPCPARHGEPEPHSHSTTAWLTVESIGTMARGQAAVEETPVHVGRHHLAGPTWD